MQIRALEVSGFRSIREAKIDFDDVTVLVGSNNAGKSSFLHALRLFFEAAPKVTLDDFYKREAESIEITVTFDNLTPDELEEFGGAVIEGKLSVSRTLSNDKDSNLSYSVRAKAFPAFAPIRAETSKSKQRDAYNELVGQLPGLSKVTSSDQALENMSQWEGENQDKLESVYVRGFFGAPNVANGKLKKKTGLHFVPAVANVSEETSDAKKSPIILLLADIARQTYENRQEVKDFIAQTKANYDGLVSPGNFPQLAQISEKLTGAIKRYYSDSKLLADWHSEEGVRFAFPQPAIMVEDAGFLSALTHVGHGLQRAALFSVVEFLATSTAQPGQEEFAAPQSDIILLIEEPEIYQHPHKQKLVSDAFRRLCEGFNAATGIRFQVVFATHSEKFLDIHKFHNARIVRREDVGGELVHSVAALSVSECSTYFAQLVNKDPMPDQAFVAKLHIFSREVCEGFFARKVILVEGVTDKAILEGAYRSAGRDHLAEGILIASVDGKTKMDKPLYIFNRLGIPAYAVFDSDANSANKKTKVNKYIQAICGVTEPEEFPDGCFERFAAFDTNLEKYLKDSCGELYEQTFDEVAGEFGLHKDDVCKTPFAILQVVSRLRAHGKAFEKFDQIIGMVDQLAPL